MYGINHMRAIPVEVNGLQFPSARAAARFIVDDELALGNARKEDTVAKELRRCWPKNGEHSWRMYGRWMVKACVVVGPAAEPQAKARDRQSKIKGIK